MSESLTQEAITALVAAARTGALNEPDSGSNGRRARRVRRVDFTRPTKFSSDQERRTHRAVDAFCRSATTRLSAELRTQLEMEVIDIDQLGWSSAHSGLPREAIGATLLTGGRRVLLAAEQAFVLSAVERLLGGDRPPAAGRRLGDIDWALSRLLFELFVTQLSPVWEELCGVPMELVGLDSTAETSHLASVSEPTLAVTVEARMLRRSSTIVLLIPYVAVAGAVGGFSGEHHGVLPDEDGRDEADAAVRGVSVDVRAEVARVRLSLGDVGALRPGDVLRLDAPVDQGVVLCADEAVVFRGHPGRLAARRAVQITSPVEVSS